MDVVTLHQAAVAGFGTLVHAVGPDQWTSPTPCAGWSVRELVNHVVGENRWAGQLLNGATVAEVGSRFDGDLLGDDPVAAWEESAAEASKAAGPSGGDG